MAEALPEVLTTGNEAMAIFRSSAEVLSLFMDEIQTRISEARLSEMST